MNADNIKRLINVLKGKEKPRFKNGPVTFNMEEFVHDTGCGTVACIAGHAAILSGEEIKGFYTARKWMGIGYDEGIAMFYHFNIGSNAGIFIRRTTAKDAVRMLEGFLKTGEVRWVTK